MNNCKNISAMFALVIGIFLTFSLTTNAQSALDGFDPNANGTIRAVVVQPDGKIIIGGTFSQVSGVTRNRIARLNPDGTLDTAFNPNANNDVYAIALQPDGKILIGGTFSGATAINGNVTRNYFARLSNNTAALSKPVISSNTIAYSRDGSAPQFSRVVFEQSTDNGATYTTLGTATNSRPAGSGKGESFAPDAPTAAGYTLTGLNLPTGQNVLIRARGFFRTGYFSGSETIEDKVQNVFLLAPSAASVSVSGRIMDGKMGIAGAVVSLTDVHGNTRTVKTTSFGYYSFEDVEVGQAITIQVSARRYSFVPQVVVVNEEMSDLNFTAQ